MIIDSHAHYSHYKFDQAFPCLFYETGQFLTEEATRESLFSMLMQGGLSASVEPAIGIESNEAVRSLTLSYPNFIFPAYGCHPTRTFSAKWHQRKIIDAFAAEGCVAIGETGLDYHYEPKDQHRFRQKAWFRYQIRLACRLGKPLILHVRNASDDVIRILKRYRKRLVGGVVHCFCDTAQIAQVYLSLGLSIGIGGYLLTEKYGAILTEAIRSIPLERILVETDSPYVLPDCNAFESKKKKYRVRNTSSVLPAVIARIAEIKGLSVSEVEKVVYCNTAKLFSLPLETGREEAR